MVQIALISVLLLTTFTHGVAVDCTNTEGKFEVPTRNNKKKSCKQVENKLKAKGWCDEPAVLENCPLDCNPECAAGDDGLCDDVSTGKFQQNGKTKYCSSVKDHPDRCDKSKYQDNCQRSCGLCPKGSFRFMQCPNNGPCCNGLSTNCGLKVNEILFATAHNANHHKGLGSNHERSLEDALEAGYRGLQLDFCKCNGELQFCHGSCNIGERDSVAVFENINNFLGSNPTEVVIINVQISVGDPTPKELWNEMMSADIMKSKVYKHEGGNWPKMETLVDDGKQLIVFYHNGPDCSDSSSSECHPKIHEFFDYAHETEWAFDSKSDLNNYSSSCPATRGNYGTKNFYSVNHFLTEWYGPTPLQASETNSEEFLENRIVGCKQQTGEAANFMNIDFWHTGDLLEVTQSENKYRKYLASTSRRLL